MSVVVTAVTVFGAEAVGATVVSWFTSAALSSAALAAIGTAVISGANTLIQGGSIGDAFKNALKGGVSSYAGSRVFQSVSGYVTDFSKSLDISPATSKIIGNVVGSAVGAGTSAALSAAFSGKNAFDAFKRSGLSALVSSSTGALVSEAASKLGFSRTSINPVQNAITKATSAAVAGVITGGDFKDSFVKSLTAQAGDALLGSIKDIVTTGWESGADAALAKAEQSLESAKSAFSSMRSKTNSIAYVESYVNAANDQKLTDALANSYKSALEKTIVPATNEDGSIDGSALVQNLKSVYGLQNDWGGPPGSYLYPIPGQPNNFYQLDLSNADTASENLVAFLESRAAESLPADMRYGANALLRGIPDKALAEYKELIAPVEAAAKEVEVALEKSLEEQAYNTGLVQDIVSDGINALAAFYDANGRQMNATELKGLTAAEDPLAYARDLTTMREALGRDVTTEDIQGYLGAEDKSAYLNAFSKPATAPEPEPTPEPELPTVPAQEEQQPSIDDLLKEIAPYEPPAAVEPEAPVEPTPEPEPETELPILPGDGEPTSVDELLKELEPVVPPTEPAPEPEPEILPEEPTPAEPEPGRGYYDEITGEFIEDENGPLPGPLDEQQPSIDDLLKDLEPVVPAPEPEAPAPAEEDLTEGAGAGGVPGPTGADNAARYNEEFAKYLEYLAKGEPAPPDYGVQDLGITQENWDEFNANLLAMQEQGRLPTQWRPNEDGTFTWQDDDGSTLTIDQSGNILGYTQAPVGNLPGETPPPQPPQPTPPRPTPPRPVQPAQPAAGGIDLAALLGLIGQQAAPQPQTVPIYGGEMKDFDLSSPLDVNFFSPSSEKQTSQQQRQTTRIATGGYLDDLLDLLR